ncbi:hypothetical protein IFM89_005484 [Coptis chinensis]|uniref:Uncharacterized protein n=1 Tax=Coptis chinensis TaxID=261450 RepID=A0A835I7L3_9MAGN|nr:hypothetical protein IFM89_005484 [Coptis chinensis]
MASTRFAFQVSSVHKTSFSPRLDYLRTSLPSALKPFLKELLHVPIGLDVSKTIKDTSRQLLTAFVDSVFQFVDHPYLPSESNFAPTEEIGHDVMIGNVEGEIPIDFPLGAYIRNGDSPAIIAAYVLNLLRFGKANKCLSNTNVFEHSGKIYSITENHMPHEIDIVTLETVVGDWAIEKSWGRPFISHPKKTPGTGELVTVGVDALKPFCVLGVVSADGKKLLQKVDLQFKRSSICHEIGVTQKYNIVINCPLTIDINRLVKGGPLIKFNKEDYTKIGVMPRYGDASSIRWFEVTSNCTFHILNCFEDGDEVIVRGCRAQESVIPGPEFGHDKVEWFSRGFKPIDPGEANGDLEVGLKYGMLAKLYLEELSTRQSEMKEHSPSEELIKVEYHKFEDNNFCSGAAFVSKHRSHDEDDGWIVCFVHHEDTNVSQSVTFDPLKAQPKYVCRKLNVYKDYK